MPQLESSGAFIDVIIVIDTDYVKTTYGPNNNAQNNPQAIDHNSEYMVCTGASSVTKQGTADLSFSASPGDQVSFRGVSVYDNSDDAVIIYGIQKYGGDNVFNTFTTNLVTRSGAVVPDPNQLNGLPATTASINFCSYSAAIRAKGTENFVVQFALYTLDKTHETQQLYGYYQWDPTIIVS